MSTFSDADIPHLEALFPRAVFDWRLVKGQLMFAGVGTAPPPPEQIAASVAALRKWEARKPFLSFFKEEFHVADAIMLELARRAGVPIGHGRDMGEAVPEGSPIRQWGAFVRDLKREIDAAAIKGWAPWVVEVPALPPFPDDLSASASLRSFYDDVKRSRT